mmetsp:Transcript_14899/g.46943  ORF Transcript_14899/g.46943 Transcript_14899/m.46943 type:complete len:239 (+) Transcript_14899:604-1320(+)
MGAPVAGLGTSERPPACCSSGASRPSPCPRRCSGTTGCRPGPSRAPSSSTSTPGRPRSAALQRRTLCAGGSRACRPWDRAWPSGGTASTRRTSPSPRRCRRAAGSRLRGASSPRTAPCRQRSAAGSAATTAPCRTPTRTATASRWRSSRGSWWCPWRPCWALCPGSLSSAWSSPPSWASPPSAAWPRAWPSRWPRARSWRMSSPGRCCPRRATSLRATRSRSATRWARACRRKSASSN